MRHFSKKIKIVLSFLLVLGSVACVERSELNRGSDTSTSETPTSSSTDSGDSDSDTADSASTDSGSDTDTPTAETDETDSESSSASDSTMDSDTDPDTSDTQTDTGSTPDSETEWPTDSNTETGTEPDSDTATDSVSDDNDTTGIDTATSTDSDSDSETAHGPDSETANGTETETESETACVPTDTFCCEHTDCAGHATCSGDGECICDNGYSGDACDYYFTALGYGRVTHTEGQATAVSADGLVVVGWSRPAIGSREPFRWKNGSNEALGTLENGYNAIPADVNADGTTLVGTAEVSTTGGLSTSVAFQWTEGQGLSSPGLLTLGTYSHATAVDNSGDIIVGDGDQDGETRGIIWRNGTPSTLQYDFAAFEPADINADGVIAVGIWDRMPSVADFDSTTDIASWLPLTDGYTSGGASLVSNDGTVVVGWLGEETNIYRWQNGQTPDAIGTFILTDASGDGAVIVGSSATDSDAMIWTETDGLQSLATILTEANVNLGGWNIEAATGISDDGKTIVGYGANGARKEGFLLRLP
jgi:probable HAF family extracellular repeat protein